MTVEQDCGAAPRKISVFGRKIPMPRSRALRIAMGVVLTVLGLFGFLPILGYWMVPLGLLVLSHEFPSIRLWRRRVVVLWGRRSRKRGLEMGARRQLPRGKRP